MAGQRWIIIGWQQYKQIFNFIQLLLYRVQQHDLTRSEREFKKKATSISKAVRPLTSHRTNHPSKTN